MVDFSSYQPPGIYVEEAQSSLVSVGGVQPSVVALVGPSIGYRTYTEPITLVGEDEVSLRQQGISTTDGFVVSSASGVEFDPSDYTLTVQAGPSGDVSKVEETTLTIARTEGSTIPDGSLVYVAYRFTDATYFAPLRASDLDDVTAVYGPAIDAVSGEIVSPLTLAAKFALDNGAGTIVLLATKGSGTTTVDELSARYSALNAEIDANIVVPLPVGVTGAEDDPGDVPDVGAGLHQFLTSQETQGIFRVGIVGLDKSVDIDPSSLVDGYRSRRIMHAHPNRMSYYNGSTSTTMEVSGYYLAAAYAGRMASQTVALPLTKKRIRGFSGIPSPTLAKMTTQRKNLWSASGVAVAEITQRNSLVVRHGTSTDQSTMVNREISLVRARDSLVNLIQDTLDNSGIIGSFITDDTTTRINGVMEGILETAISQNFIVGYNNVRSRQTVGQPSIIEVRFQYKPAYPLNYILISFSVNTESGELGVDLES